MGNKTGFIDTILHFSLRIDAVEAGPDIVRMLEEAFGARFKPKSENGVSYLQMYLLGMTVDLVQWRGIGLKMIYQLMGSTEQPEGHQEQDKPMAFVDLNQAVIDLLRANGAGKWHTPSIAEIEAEGSTEASHAMDV